jgi:hypothetical protein
MIAEVVVAGELGGRTGTGRQVSQLDWRGEDVSRVLVGATSEGDVGVLPVLAAGEHGQADAHGAALVCENLLYGFLP